MFTKKCVVITTVIGFLIQIIDCCGCNCSEDKQNKTLTDLQKKVIKIKEDLRKDEDKLVKYIKTQFKLNDKDIIRKTFSVFTDYTIETLLKIIEDGEKVENAKEEDKVNLKKENEKKYDTFMKSFEKTGHDLDEECINMSRDPSIGVPVFKIVHEVKDIEYAIPVATYLFVINRGNAISNKALEDACFNNVKGEYQFSGEYPEDLKS